MSLFGLAKFIGYSKNLLKIDRYITILLMAYDMQLNLQGNSIQKVLSGLLETAVKLCKIVSLF